MQNKLIPGKTNIYVDGSFISSIHFPLVSPSETFDCPLGMDQSIRIVYHPRVSKASTSGFYSKTSNVVFSQRITVYNKKTSTVNDLVIIDQVPVSADAQILSVALKSPELAMPEASATGDIMAPSPAKVENEVTAQWCDSGTEGDLESLGKDGKMKWVCSVAPQKKLNLLLQWGGVFAFPGRSGWA